MPIGNMSQIALSIWELSEDDIAALGAPTRVRSFQP